MDIGKKITQIRKARGLSQKEIALSVGVDRAQYSRIENDKANPTLSSLEKIATALNVSLKEFFLDDKSYDIDSYDKSLVEKVKLLEQLPEKQRAIVFAVIDTVVTNQKLKDNIQNLANL